MELNVDVICCLTGEVLKEGVTVESAQEFITRKYGKVVCSDVQKIDLDDIDGGGQMEVKSLWVEIPEIQEEIRKQDEYLKNAREFWQN
jgi:hypothetical protein